VMLIDTDAVRRQHPLADVVAGYGIELRRSGSTLVSRCPFHADGGRPNLTVYTSGRWICYRCGEKGDVIGFVQRMEQLGFREAVARLGGAEAECPTHRPRPRRVPSVRAAIAIAIDTLLERGLIAHTPTHLFVTTAAFLEFTAMRDLADLPSPA
jgi:DNA primase